MKKIFLLFLLCAGLASEGCKRFPVDPVDPRDTVRSTGHALQFNGASYVKMPGSESLLFNSKSCTFEAWVRPQLLNGNWQIILNKSFSNNDNDMLLLIDRSTSSFRFITRALHNDIYGKTHVQPGRWYHVAGVQDLENKSVTLYVNGEADGYAELQGPVVSNAAPLLLGCRTEVRSQNAPVEFFNGAMDEIRIWGYARSRNEIRANMHKALQGNERGLLHYWNCDEKSGTVITDPVAELNGRLNGVVFIPSDLELK